MPLPSRRARVLIRRSRVGGRLRSERYLSQRLDIPYQEAVLHGPPTFYEYDLSKAKELIDFAPQYDIIRMIEDALAYREGKTIDILPTE